MQFAEVPVKCQQADWFILSFYQETLAAIHKGSTKCEILFHYVNKSLWF